MIMKALKITCYQETACYKQADAFKFNESYPLPPYSTIRGMLMTLLDEHTLLPLKLCVQGDFESVVSTYTHTKIFKPKNKQVTEIVTRPMQGSLLYNVHLVIYVVAEDALLNRLYKAFQTNTKSLFLGRNEDIIRFDNVEWVQLTPVEDEEDDNAQYALNHTCYVPKVYCPNCTQGIPYVIPHSFTYKYDWREFKKVDVFSIPKGQCLTDIPHYVDDTTQHDLCIFDD